MKIKQLLGFYGGGKNEVEKGKIKQLFDFGEWELVRQLVEGFSEGG